MSFKTFQGGLKSRADSRWPSGVTSVRGAGRTWEGEERTGRSRDRCYQTLGLLRPFLRAREELRRDVMSAFPLTSWKACKTTPRVMKPPLETPTTSATAFLNR